MSTSSHSHLPTSLVVTFSIDEQGSDSFLKWLRNLKIIVDDNEWRTHLDEVPEYWGRPPEDTSVTMRAVRHRLSDQPPFQLEHLGNRVRFDLDIETGRKTVVTACCSDARAAGAFLRVLSLIKERRPESGSMIDECVKALRGGDQTAVGRNDGAAYDLAGKEEKDKTRLARARRNETRHNRRVSIWWNIDKLGLKGMNAKYILNRLPRDKGKPPCGYDMLLDVLKRGNHGELGYYLKDGEPTRAE